MKRKACASERTGLDDDEAALTLTLPLSVSLWYTQEHIARTVRKMFPEEWSNGVCFPCTEDFINHEPFNTWAIWRRMAKGYPGRPPSRQLGWQENARRSILAFLAGSVERKNLSLR